MKPSTVVLLLGVTLGGVATSAPVDAQSWHVSVGGSFVVSQGYPQGPPPGGYGYPQGPGYPGRPGDARGYGYGSGYDEYALSTGYRDGYEQGLDASRDRDRFDPRRERWYREGDRGYKRDARMSRDRYKDLYRRGFLDGYEAGYRDAQYGYSRGGYGHGAQPPYGGRPRWW